jgi:nucleoside-diphosphate kinase
MKERTLSIIKPDAVKKNAIGDILRRFENAGLKIVAAKLTTLSKAQAQGFYAVHKERPFFDSLTTFMSSGPVLISVLEGADAIQTNRRLMGATDPAKADAGTIRKDWATDVEKNAAHGSDGPDTAKWEISYFFSEMEIQNRL